MKNFWQKLKKPIYALAPMAGVTDSAFRQICKSFGAEVVYSEMASVTALVYSPEKTLELLKFSKIERPYVVQLFGSKPDHFAQAVKIVESVIKPDGIDINFGCPVKKVARQGAGAALMNDFKLSREILNATIANTRLPVSLKCRARVGEVNVLKFLDSLAGLDIKAVMIHGRTLAQGHSGEVDWKIIKQAKKFVKGLLLANGGVRNFQDAWDLLDKTGADGVGIGQGVLGMPWLFEQLKITNDRLEIKNADEESGKDKISLTSFDKKGKSGEEIFKIALNHAKLAEKLKGKQGLMEMRKHLCWYVGGLPNAGDLRRQLVKINSLVDIKKTLS